MHEHREVRVTARESVRTPFAAPELSPVRTVDAELEKGTKGWTSDDKVEIVSFPEAGLPAGLLERRIGDLKVGSIIRKAPVKGKRVVSATGPSPHYRAMQARAVSRAAR